MYRILIVDDSRISRLQIKKILPIDNVVVAECDSGSEAIEKLKDNYYHLILLDLLMPEIDGFSVLRFIKDNCISIKIIVISADIQDSTRKEVEQLGAFAFLNKPPDKSKLNDLIKQLMESETN
ncbi:MAG TPA: response regulator [Candidatus Kapabacteria bacterium]|nr:response regulator [Candidatus Kapabacteria bacterium]